MTQDVPEKQTGSATSDPEKKDAPSPSTEEQVTEAKKRPEREPTPQDYFVSLDNAAIPLRLPSLANSIPAHLQLCNKMGLLRLCHGRPGVDWRRCGKSGAPTCLSFVADVVVPQTLPLMNVVFGKSCMSCISRSPHADLPRPACGRFQQLCPHRPKRRGALCNKC